MNAVEKPASLPPGAQIWPLSVTAYRTLGEMGLIPRNTELLHGIVYQKMSKSPLHSALVRQLLKLLRELNPPGCFLSSEQPITCDEATELEPDIAVIRGSEAMFWTEHPRTAELVIEVSVTSHDYDRSKLATYAAAGVKECWLVLGPEKQVEIHRQPAGRRYAERTVAGPGGIISSIVLPTVALELNALFNK